MIKTDRSKVQPPGVLYEPYKNDQKTELERATEHMNDPNRKGSFEFSRYKSVEVKEALEKLFHGKCAYCESNYSSIQPVDVEHFRPKAKVEGDDQHPGYWWLAMEWTNLLPSCIDCNRRRNQKTPKADSIDLVEMTRDGDLNRSKTLATGKACAFPLAEGGIRSIYPQRSEPELGAEGALLLDPTRDNPDDHLVFVVSREHQISLVGAKPVEQNSTAHLPSAEGAGAAGQVSDAASAAKVSEKGAVSIQVYGLNRLGLVQARTRVLRELELLLEMSIGLREVSLSISERNGLLKAKKKTASASLAGELQEEIDFNAKIQAKIDLYTSEIKKRFAEMVEDKAPHAAVARAWVNAYLKV